MVITATAPILLARSTAYVRRATAVMPGCYAPILTNVMRTLQAVTSTENVATLTAALAVNAARDIAEMETRRAQVSFVFFSVCTNFVTAAKSG